MLHNIWSYRCKNTCFPVLYLISVRFLKLWLFRTFAISNKISGPLRIRNNGRLLYLKTSGNDVSKLFLTLRRHENNEKLKMSSTIKTRAHSLLVTFDVLKKINLGVQYFVFWFIWILKFCMSLFSSPFWQLWLNFSQVTRSFAELFSRDDPAILKLFDLFFSAYI